MKPITLKNEQNAVAEEARKERETEVHNEPRYLAEIVDGKLKGIGFVGGFHSVHDDEKIGAIVPDCRTDKAKRLFDGIGSSRDTVIQACRANPLAQVWLAGTTTSPKIAYHLMTIQSEHESMARRPVSLSERVADVYARNLRTGTCAGASLALLLPLVCPIAPSPIDPCLRA
jgi:hypothetical protein